MTRIVFVGEAWGEMEALANHPFVGPAGFELLQLLEDSGILELSSIDREHIKNRWNTTGVLAAHYMRQIWDAHRDEFHLTNVFSFRPENNDIDTLCTNKAGNRISGFPAIRAGKYIRSEFLPEINRLYAELKAYAPNLIVALGATACWALLHNSGVTRVRGTVTLGATGHKVIPTYHPAAILRQYDLRAVTVIDLEKARHEATFREIRRAYRKVYIEPTLTDLDWFYNYHIVKARLIAPDIETVARQISCVGFATDKETSIVVPFIDNRNETGSYWATPEEEVLAWGWVRKVLATPQPKIFQNGVYDVNFLWRGYGIPVTNFSEDTMLLHHALQPESPKGLGYLGSVYANEEPWKLLGRKATKTIKRDE